MAERELRKKFVAIERLGILACALVFVLLLSFFWSLPRLYHARPMSLQAGVQTPVPQHGRAPSSNRAGQGSRGSPHFVLQLTAVESRAEAEKLAAQISKKYQFPAEVMPVDLRGQRLYRVRIPAATQREAEALAAALRRDQQREVWISASGMD